MLRERAVDRLRFLGDADSTQISFPVTPHNPGRFRDNLSFPLADKIVIMFLAGRVACIAQSELNSCLITSIIARGDVEESDSRFDEPSGIYSSRGQNRASVMEIFDENGKGHKCHGNCEAARKCSVREFDILLPELAYDRLFSSLWFCQAKRR